MRNVLAWALIAVVATTMVACKGWGDAWNEVARDMADRDRLRQEQYDRQQRYYQEAWRNSSQQTRYYQPPARDSTRDASSWCFVGSTPVVMADGSARAIRDIEPGDRVLSVPADAPLGTKPQPREVLRTYATPDIEVVRVGGVVSTGGHPFLAADGSWQRVESIGSAVTAYDSVARIRCSEPIGRRTVYNLLVDEYHTYIVVGSHWWIVHNGGGGDDVRVATK